MGKNRMQLLTPEALEKLTTPRLLAYRKRLLKAHETAHWDGSQEILTKDSPVWQEHYVKVKEILDQREHVPSTCKRGEA